MDKEERIKKIAESLVKLGIVSSEKDVLERAKEIVETEDKVKTMVGVKAPKDKPISELIEEDDSE